MPSPVMAGVERRGKAQSGRAMRGAVRQVRWCGNLASLVGVCSGSVSSGAAGSASRCKALLELIRPVWERQVRKAKLR